MVASKRYKKAKKRYIKAKKSYKKKKSRFQKTPAFLAGSKRSEIKWVDGFNLGVSGGQTQQFNNINASNQIIALNLVGSGTSTYQRVGDHTKGLYCKIKGQIYPDEEKSQVDTEYLRVAVVYDRAPTGAYPAYSDIYNDIDAGGSNSFTCFSSPNITNKSRFTILKEMDLTKPFKNSTNQTNQPVFSSIQYDDQNLIDWYLPLDGCDTNYLDTTSPPQIGDVANGAIYIMAIGSENTSATAAFNLAFKTRYVYSDK